jgi:hypothetical protein
MLELRVCEAVPVWVAAAGAEGADLAVVAVVLAVAASVEAGVALVVVDAALVAAGAEGIRLQANKYWKAISRK